MTDSGVTVSGREVAERLNEVAGFLHGLGAAKESNEIHAYGETVVEAITLLTDSAVPPEASTEAVEGDAEMLERARGLAEWSAMWKRLDALVRRSREADTENRRLAELDAEASFLADLLRAALASGQTPVTREPELSPAGPGWYWLVRGDGREPEPVYVEEGPDGDLWFDEGGWAVNEVVVEGRWRGPIPKPENADV